MKYVLRVFLVLIPVLLFVGVMRKAIDVDQPFMPTYSELFNMFANMPDLIGDVREAVNYSSLLIDGNTASWGAIVDAGTFFEAIGSFFQMVGSFFIVAYRVVAVPFKFFHWFIPTFFGFAETVSA